MDCDKRIETTSRSDIDDMLSLRQSLEGEGICHAGKGLHGRVRQRCNKLVIVPEMLCQVAARVEVIFAMRISRDFAIFAFDVFAQALTSTGIGGSDSTAITSLLW